MQKPKTVQSAKDGKLSKPWACAAVGGHATKAVIANEFGRCAGFIVSDATGQEREWIENSKKDASHGAGTGASKLLASLGVTNVVGPRFGPKAIAALSAGGIKRHVAAPGTTLDEVFAALLAGALPEVRDDA